MSEVKKRVVIASVLKPVNDTRMGEKLAQTLAGTRQFDVHVIGFPIESLSPSDFTVHPLPYFKRLSLKRLFIPWSIFRKSKSLRPDLLIITTHELLAVAMLMKTITGCKVIYDIQENYYRNIFHTPAFPFFIRPFIALYVRSKEILSSPFIDHYFLAEKGYVDEFSFQGNKFTVLENKVQKPIHLPDVRNDYNKLLFSGTLSETSGVFIAIEVAAKLRSIDSRITLTLAGFCPQESTLIRLQKLIEVYPFITLIGGDQLIPHREILQHIRQADAGIIAYPPNPSTRSSTPTKLFEYLGFKLPILLINHPPWVQRCAPFQAAYAFNPGNIDAENMLESLKSRNFYTHEPNDVFWESEEPRLIRAVLQFFY